jgi:hypothetical protein
MKIKTLAIAAATLAVGAITSQAQVYSQNVVGYATVIYPAGKYIMSANPFTTGNDVITNVITSPTGASYLYYWTGSTWTTYQYSGSAKQWKSGAVNENNAPLPPGVGYFIVAATAFTNTYTGTIVANTGGGMATNSLTSNFAPVGSLIPYGDSVTNSSTLNLKVAGASSLQQWDVNLQTFKTAFVYSGSGKVWKQGSTVTNPVIGVAEGFFIQPSSATNWVQTLQ